MERCGSQRKYKCVKADFPISIQIAAKGMSCFQGVLSCAKVKNQNTKSVIKTFPMCLKVNGLVGTSTVPSPNSKSRAKIYITFAGYFTTAQGGASPQYEIKLTTASGDEAVTKLSRPKTDPALARLIFQT